MALRERQRDHSFVLLMRGEFASLTETGKIKLPARHREHFGRILRRNSDWDALVGDGLGQLIEAKVQEEWILANGSVYQAPARVGETILAQAWIKQKSLALVLQKCAELGVTRIFLVDTDLSPAHSEKPERMRTILESACMQAYNPNMPRIELFTSLAEIPLGNYLAVFGDLAASLKISEIRRQPGESAIFFNGPEGGWTDREAALLREKARGVLLSENVLRAETAAIIAAGFLALQ